MKYLWQQAPSTGILNDVRDDFCLPNILLLLSNWAGLHLSKVYHFANWFHLVWETFRALYIDLY